MRKQRNYMRSYLESGISTLRVKRNSSGSDGIQQGQQQLRLELKQREVSQHDGEETDEVQS